VSLVQKRSLRSGSTSFRIGVSITYAILGLFVIGVR